MVKQLYFANSKTHAPFRLCFVTLKPDFNYNLEVSFSFCLTFLQFNVIEMFTVQQKLLLPHSRLSSSSSRHSNFFRFPLKVRVIGSWLYFLLSVSRFGHPFDMHVLYHNFFPLFTTKNDSLFLLLHHKKKVRGWRKLTFQTTAFRKVISAKILFWTWM